MNSYLTKSQKKSLDFQLGILKKSSSYSCETCNQIVKIAEGEKDSVLYCSNCLHNGKVSKLIKVETKKKKKNKDIKNGKVTIYSLNSSNENQ